jgi:hypothetical protein
MRPPDKSSDWRSRTEQLSFPQNCGGASPPPHKEKEQTAHSITAREVGTPTTLGIFPHSPWKRRYTLTGWHLIRETLRMSSLMEEAVETVGELSPLEMSHREGRLGKSQTSQAQKRRNGVKPVGCSG